MSNFLEENFTYYSIAVLLLISTLVIVNSYYHHDGYLTPDSTHYLSAVKSMNSNKPFFVKNNVLIGEDDKLFATWPLGYPLLIWVTSKIVGSIFWASKILNIFLCLGFIILFNIRFRKSSKVFYPLLLFGGSIYLFSATLTESLFTFLFFSVILCLEYILFFIQKVKWFHYMILLSLTLSLPLTRYAGVFIFFFLGLFIFFKLLKKDYKRLKILIFTLLTSSLLYAFYLLFNFYFTGTITGGERPFVFNLKLEIVLKALLGELIFIYPGFSWKALAIQCLSILVLFWFFKIKIEKPNKGSLKNQISLNLYGQAGLFYLVFIILLGAITDFRDYNFRFLYPGSFLILIYLLAVALKKISVDSFLKIAYILGIISVFYNGYILYKSKVRRPLVYTETVQETLKEFKEVSAGSIIVNPPKHLNYLRTDLLLLNSWYYKDEKDYFNNLEKFYPEKSIYKFSTGSKAYEKIN